MCDENEVVLRLVQRLREIRESRGISQYRLAKDTGLSPSGIRHMENGRVSPTLYFLLKVCGHLGEDLPALLAEAFQALPGAIDSSVPPSSLKS